MMARCALLVQATGPELLCDPQESPAFNCKQIFSTWRSP
jgi:hypothetical protein